MRRSAWRIRNILCHLLRLTTSYTWVRISSSRHLWFRHPRCPPPTSFRFVHIPGQIASSTSSIVPDCIYICCNCVSAMVWVRVGESMCVSMGVFLGWWGLSVECLWDSRFPQCQSAPRNQFILFISQAADWQSALGVRQWLRQTLQILCVHSHRPHIRRCKSVCVSTVHSGGKINGTVKGINSDFNQLNCLLIVFA